MTCSTFTLLCSHNLQPSTEPFSPCTETLCSLSNNSLLSLPLALGKHHSPFYSYEFEYSKYRIWVESYSIFPFVAGFISLSIKVLKVRPCHSMCQNFFLSKGEWYSTVCIHHFFFVTSSVDGHQVCFQLLAILNNPVKNTSVHLCLYTSAFNHFGCMPINGVLRFIFSHVGGSPHLQQAILGIPASRQIIQLNLMLSTQRYIRFHRLRAFSLGH